MVKEYFCKCPLSTLDSNRERDITSLQFAFLLLSVQSPFLLLLLVRNCCLSVVNNFAMALYNYSGNFCGFSTNRLFLVSKFLWPVPS